MNIDLLRQIRSKSGLVLSGQDHAIRIFRNQSRWNNAAQISFPHKGGRMTARFDWHGRVAFKAIRKMLSVDPPSNSLAVTAE